MTEENSSFFAIVEQMGHKRIAGRVTEVVLAGHGFLRIDVPSADDPEKWSATQFISPASGSIYALTPVSEEVARAVARTAKPEPVHTWELPQIEHRGRENDGSSEYFCTVISGDPYDEPVQCGEPAQYDPDAKDFRCAKHG